MNDRQTNLWRELADGTGGPSLRISISLALAPLFAGAACFISFAAATLVPKWAAYGSEPADELIASMLVLASFGYVASLIWIWKRSRHKLNEFLQAGLLTVAVFIAAIFSCGLLLKLLIIHGGEDILVCGILCVAGSVVLLIWIRAARRFVRSRPTHNLADGKLDVRCPSCGYRMVGLYHSRCPECGATHTLDELLARQQFLLPQSSEPSAPAP